MCISKERRDELIQDQGLPEKPPHDETPKFGIDDGDVIYSTNAVGAILLEDEMWHPFRYFDDGHLDIGDDAFCKPSSAFKIAKATYT